MQTPQNTKPPTTQIIKFTKQQRNFIKNWLDPNSETVGNAYQSAIEAGYKHSTARVLAIDSRGVEWIQEAKRLYASTMTPDHIYLGVQDIAKNTRADRDKLKAYEMLGKFNGMFIEKHESNVNVNFTNSVPRPIIDVEPEAPEAIATDHNQ